MILTGNAIQENVAAGKIKIDPFHQGHVNPNSYDVMLGDRLLVYKSQILDSASTNSCDEMIIPPDGFVLRKNQFYLGHTLNQIGSEQFVPILHCKSGIARLGLFIHITADLVDIGFYGNLTLQLFPTNEIRVFAGMRIAQISFWMVQGSIKLYSGKYQNAQGPVASRSFLDHKKRFYDVALPALTMTV